MAAEVCAHITGTVWKIEAQQGQQVNEGDTLIILESMKMEMPIEAPMSGRVVEIRIQEGQPVAEGAIVVIMEEG